MSTPRTALITGANRGLGLQAAKELAARGFHVFLGMRDPTSAREALGSINPTGPEPTVVPINVSDSASIRRAVGDVAARISRLDVLVNNAGIYPDADFNILTVSRDVLAQAFATNTFGPLEVVQAFRPLLRNSDNARVINVSSGYGQLAGLSSDVPSYCLSKLALNGVTLMLATKLRADQTSVNSVCPGWVRTDMGGSNATRSVEEGAAGIVWLAVDAPHSLTGRFFRDGHEIEW